MTPRRLYRCRDDRRIAGVAAGIAEYLEVDPTVVRVAWVLSALLGGLTIVLYAILAFLIPLEPRTETAPADEAGDAPAPGLATAHEHRSTVRRGTDGRPGNGGLVLGALLVTFGAIALAGPFLPGWIAGVHLGPAFILALGIALIVGAARRDRIES